jgi:hypothetical protein
MAKRSIQQKKLNRFKKLFRRTPDRYINPVEWLKDRGYASTSGQARQIIFDGRLRSESHKVGFLEIAGHKSVAMIPAEMRKTLVVTSA